jgi:hypothetical protein
MVASGPPGNPGLERFPFFRAAFEVFVYDTQGSALGQGAVEAGQLGSQRAVCPGSGWSWALLTLNPTILPVSPWVTAETRGILEVDPILQWSRSGTRQVRTGLGSRTGGNDPRKPASDQCLLPATQRQSTGSRIPGDLRDMMTAAERSVIPLAFCVLAAYIVNVDGCRQECQCRLSDDLMKGSPGMPGGSLTSKPTWSNT